VRSVKEIAKVKVVVVVADVVGDSYVVTLDTRRCRLAKVVHNCGFDLSVALRTDGVIGDG
jgi:hypothetical protein